MTIDRFSPFAFGVAALDEALVKEPVFVAEKGLTRRQERLERAFAKALANYIKELKHNGYLTQAMTDDLLKTIPEV